MQTLNPTLVVTEPPPENYDFKLPTKRRIMVNAPSLLAGAGAG
jgi:hypothetical protein